MKSVKKIKKIDGLNSSLMACLFKLTDKVETIKKIVLFANINLNASMHIMTDVDGKPTSQ